MQLHKPYSQEAEEAVIGSIIIDPMAFHEISPIVDMGDFYMFSTRSIYKAAQSLNGRKMPIDILTLSEECKRLGFFEGKGAISEADIFLLVNATPTSINAAKYARIVSEKATRRRMIETAQKIANAAYDEAGDLEDQLSECESDALSMRGMMGADHWHKPRQHISDFVTDMEERWERGEEMIGIPSGLEALDDVLGGFVDGQHYIFAARSGMGKSSLLINMADNQARMGYRVAFFSMEMSTNQINYRRTSYRTRVPHKRIKSGKITQGDTGEEGRIFDNVGMMSEDNFHIDTTPGLKPAQFMSKVKRMIAEVGVDIIYIDYIGKMSADKQKNQRNMEMSDIMGAVTNFGFEVDIPIISAHQLNRDVEKRQSKIPMLSDLRDSGSIEQDAYAVTFIHRDDYYNKDGSSMRPGEVDLIIAKHREGEEKTAVMKWDGSCSAFLPLNKVTVDLSR